MFISDDASRVEALHDDATGLLTWEAFAAFATLTISQSRRRGGASSLLLVGLDQPRGLDEDGSDAAAFEEAAALSVSGALQKTLRGGDMLGRHSARSFVILAQDAQQAGAARLTERLRAALPDDVAIGTRSFPVTVSMGVATQPDVGQTLPELLGNAEEALIQAGEAGGNCVRVSGVNTLITNPLPSAGSAPVVPQPSIESERLAEKRRQTLARLLESYQNGQIEGISLETQPGACPVCLDAALDPYLPAFVPSLPLAGCVGPAGCRCNYGAPAVDPRRRPPPVPALSYTDLDIPRKLRDAALFGSEPKRKASPQEIAEYLDRLPLLPFQVELELQAGEVPYLLRTAKRSVERPIPGRPPVHGPMFPMRGPLTLWVKAAGRPPSLPDALTPNKDEGAFYLTNWRILFSRKGAVESILLADVAAVEYLRDAIACTVGQRSNRIIFFVKDALQIGLYVTRAVRDVAALTR